MELRMMGCCGIKELTGLSYCVDAKTAMQDFAVLTCLRKAEAYQKDGSLKWIHAPVVNFRYVVFSQAHKESAYGLKFAAFIRDQGLGTLEETGFSINPNSGNQLKAWIWTVDHDALKSWAEANPKAPVAQQASTAAAAAAAPAAAAIVTDCPPRARG